MKAHPDCVPCVFQQVLRASRRLTNDDQELFALQAHTMDLLRDRVYTGSPSDLSGSALRAVADHFGVEDLYAKERRRTNQIMLQLEPQLRKLIEYSPDVLSTALRLAAAANMIDFGITDNVDISAALEKAMTISFAIDHSDQLRKDVARSKKLLYIADNAGEIVVDKLVLEAIGHKNAWVGVRGAPIFTDVTVADAEEAGIGAVARIISSGSVRLGVVIEDCSAQFKRCLTQADLIISKGQANFQTLHDLDKTAYFIMTAKCDLIARRLGVRLGDVVVAKRDLIGKDE